MKDEKLKVIFRNDEDCKGIGMYDDEVDDIDEDYKPYTVDELILMKRDWEHLFADNEHPYEDHIYMDINGTEIDISKRSCIEMIDKIIKENSLP